MACINPNSSSFKAALEKTGNPLLAELEVDAIIASPNVISKMKIAATQMGIDIQDLAECNLL